MPRKKQAPAKRGRPPGKKPAPKAKPGDATHDVLKAAAELKVERINYLRAKMAEGKTLSKSELDLLNDHIDDLEAEGGNPVKERFRNAQEVANHYGVTPGTVSEHVRRGNISPNADGSFDKANTDAYWCGKRGRAVVPIRGKPGNGNGNGAGQATPQATASPEHSIQAKIDAERLRKMKAEAETKEFLAAQMRGSLVSKDDMLRVWCSRIEMFRDALMHLAVRLPPVLVNLTQNEIESVLRNEAESIIKAFAKHGKYTPRSVKPKRTDGN